MSGSTIQFEPIVLMSSVQLVFESKTSCLCGSLDNTGLRLAVFDEAALSTAISDRNQPTMLCQATSLFQSHIVRRNRFAVITLLRSYVIT